MKDLTHYFNSPSPSLKKPETSPAENKNLVDEKTPKMNKKVRKKRLKLDKLTPPQAADSKQDLPFAENGTEVAKSEVVNGDSNVIDVGSDTGCNTASERKKKKRKLSPSCEDASKRTKRKVAKGRLKIINVPSDSPDSSNSPKPQLETPNDSGLAKDILVNSLLVDKLSMLVSDHEDDGGYEIEDDSDQDEDYSSKKVKRKRKKRKSTKRTSVEKDGTVGTPLVNDNLGEKESAEKIVEVEPVTEKRNSLFSYYSKVDKSVINKERTSEKIRVQALVHTPPSEKRRSSSNHTPSSSAKASLKKKFIRLQRELMKASDAIEVVSSEEIVQSGTLNAENSCDTSATLLNDSNSCVAAELDVKTVHDWKIKINSKLTKSESVSTEDTLDNENEPPNSNTNNASDTLSKNDFNKLLSNKRTRKPNPKYSETVDKSEKSSETTANKVKNIKRQSKLKKSPPCPTIDLDESSNDSVCEARVVRESNANKNLNKNAKISSINGKSAGLMAKFLGKSLVTPKETVSKIVKVDPSVLIARQKFLKSGLPDDFRQKIASQIDENIPDPPPFPSVSHIQQRDPMRLIWNIPEPQLLKLGPSPTIDLELSSDWQNLFPDCQSDSSEHSDNGEPIKKIRNKSFIKDFLRTKANTQQSVNDRWALMKKLKSSGVDSACWTDIYKPKASNDILGNKSCVERFKIWLETYKNTAVKQTGEEGSSDDFVHSSDDSCSSPKERICIISGPIGCGKTSTVYAVAQELGYKVLEVNASHNRNGKKVTADLSEATQSHQVEHGSLKDIFNNSRKVKKKKTKNKPVKSDGSSKKRSLILVEDADLLFEGFDEGFISAIAALSLTSKRPMVFTVNNKKPQHFSKFVRPSDLMLEFQRPSSSNLASWLQMIAMAEGIHLDDGHAELLANWSNNDIRKSLVQLQYLAQSCEEIAKWPKFIDRARWPSAVTKDDICDTRNDVTIEDGINIMCDITARDDIVTTEDRLEERSQVTHRNNAKDEIKIKCDITTKDNVTSDDSTRNKASKSEMIASLKSLARRSDSLLISDLLATQSRDSGWSCDPCPRPQRCVCSDSTALTEASANSGGQLTNYLVDDLIRHVATCVRSDVRCPSKRWKSDNNLKTAVPLMVRCSHSMIHSDYLPALRFFGQCEDLRLSAYTRRNRNFNYLQGLGVNTSEGLTFDAFL